MVPSYGKGVTCLSIATAQFFSHPLRLNPLFVLQGNVVRGLSSFMLEKVDTDSCSFFREGVSLKFLENTDYTTL